MYISNQFFGESDIFPQANDIYKVIMISEIYVENTQPTSKELMGIIDVTTERQIQYYISASQFLGILSSERTITKIGKLVFAQRLPIKLELIVYLILSVSVFQLYFITRDNTTVIEELIGCFGLSESTAKRRFSTVVAWVDWCDIIIKDYGLDIVIGKNHQFIL